MTWLVPAHRRQVLADRSLVLQPELKLPAVQGEPDPAVVVVLAMVRATNRAQAVAEAPAMVQDRVVGQFSVVARTRAQKADGQALRRESAPRGRRATAAVRWPSKLA
jgi:hypothetical protein